ncbi:MAG: Cof-type HAD-IIB family hydrolase [Firmicutes bacterium]|nr:Cof-type HAD-IIB family hydrolase [Bacillota bacterium]
MKLVVADLDGTLVHKGFSKETLNTVKKLQDQGLIFTIATGRHFLTAKDYVKELNVKYPAIYSNGAYIYDMENNKVIYQALIDESTSLQVMEICNRSKVDFIIYTVNHIYTTQKARDKMVSIIGIYDMEIVSEDELKLSVKNGVIKILVIDDDMKRIKEVRETLSQIKEIYPIQSQKNFLDIGHHLANKGNALSILAKHFNISLQDSMAIGDQENDIKMIQVAGVGVAMGDGSSLLKDEADFITKSFQENGFSYAVEKYFFSK